MTEGARGGRGRCRACNSPDQDTINRALALGRPSLRVLEKRYGIGKTSLAEHKTNHLSPGLVVLNQERQLDGRGLVAAQLEDLLGEVRSMYEAAKKSHNFQQALQALGKLLTALELQAKITGELDERPQVTVNLHQTQEWIQLRAVILEVLAPYPDAERKLANRLKLLEGGSA